MMKNKTKLVMAILIAGLVLIQFVPVSTAFIVMLIGLLVVPPAIAVVTTLISGVSVISKELEEPENESIVITT